MNMYSILCATSFPGNVAYRKSASQVSYTWGDQFPADRAVDGNVDKWRSHEHCALPDRGQGTNAWWQVDLGGIFDILRVEIYSGNNSEYNNLHLVFSVTVSSLSTWE